MNIAEQLASAGMSAQEASEKAELFDAAEKALRDSRSDDFRRWFVPGRIEVLGKHTDYAGGRSLLCTAERGICVVARPRPDSIIRIFDVARQQNFELHFSTDIRVSKSGWVAYPQTVARRLARNFRGKHAGADIAIASDLPAAAGMSSSSALVIAIYSALASANELEHRPEYTVSIRSLDDLGAYLSCIENGQSFGSLSGDTGVGTFGGSEDHTAILNSRAGELSQYSFCPIRFERSVELPADCGFVIASSGISAPKIGAARDQYNRVSQSAKNILEICRERLDSRLDTLADAAGRFKTEEIVRAINASSRRGFTNEELILRFEQFVLESERIIPAASDALSRKDWETFGALVDQSQTGAETGLRNQVPETIALARMARLLGARAASAFGAGFGGGVWAMVPRSDAQKFIKEWFGEYREQFPVAASTSEFFVTGAGPSLTELS